MARKKVETEFATEQTTHEPVSVEQAPVEPTPAAHSAAPLAGRIIRRLGRVRIIVVVVLIVGWICAAYFYTQYSTLKNDPQVAAQLEAARTLNQLMSIIEVPQGELPSFAVINDPALLSGDAFFERAQPGDVLIVYTQARQAYLYRPSAHKVINVGAFVQGAAAAPAKAFEVEDNETAE